MYVKITRHETDRISKSNCKCQFSSMQLQSNKFQQCKSKVQIHTCARVGCVCVSMYLYVGVCIYVCRK